MTYGNRVVIPTEKENFWRVNKGFAITMASVFTVALFGMIGWVLVEVVNMKTTTATNTTEVIDLKEEVKSLREAIITHSSWEGQIVEATEKRFDVIESSIIPVMHQIFTHTEAQLCEERLKNWSNERFVRK